jgi:hypothetical protein
MWVREKIDEEEIYREVYREMSREEVRMGEGERILFNSFAFSLSERFTFLTVTDDRRRCDEGR